VKKSARYAGIQDITFFAKNAGAVNDLLVAYKVPYAKLGYSQEPDFWGAYDADPMMHDRMKEKLHNILERNIAFLELKLGEFERSCAVDNVGDGQHKHTWLWLEGSENPDTQAFYRNTPDLLQFSTRVLCAQELPIIKEVQGSMDSLLKIAVREAHTAEELEAAKTAYGAALVEQGVSVVDAAIRIGKTKEEARKVDSCVESIMEDSDFKPKGGRTKKESAFAICQSRILGSLPPTALIREYKQKVGDISERKLNDFLVGLRTAGTFPLP